MKVKSYKKKNPEVQKRYREKHRDKLKIKHRIYYLENKHKWIDRAKSHWEETVFYTRKRNLWRDFKITLNDYDDIWIEQLGLCAICKRRSEDERKKFNRELAVDHNHTTNIIRGLLCSPCNRGIGMFQDDSTILKHASEYVK